MLTPHQLCVVRQAMPWGKTCLTLINSRAFQVVLMKLVESQASLVHLCKLECDMIEKEAQGGRWISGQRPLSCKLGDLSMVPVTHVKVEEENGPDFYTYAMACACPYAHMCTWVCTHTP